MRLKASKILAWVFWLSVGLGALAALSKYPGRGSVYLLFSIVFNGLLLAGFRKKRLFFDTFIGLFFWLGFWFKSTAVFLLRGGRFPDAKGHFDFSGPAFDQALLISSVGAIALLVASMMRERSLSFYASPPVSAESQPVSIVYKKYRNIILVSFLFLFVMIAYTNLWFGIYQRGSVPRTYLPFGLNGVYTWLLLFGLTSFSAVIIDCECRINASPYLVMWLALLETFCSNVSMLSRGMIVNASSLMLGAIGAQQAQAFFLTRRFKFIALIALTCLFSCSVLTVSFVRRYQFSLTPSSGGNVIPRIGSAREAAEEAGESFHTSSLIFINRWVGIEGAMAVSSCPNLGWNLWARAWQERASNVGTSFYDREIARSNYMSMDLSNHHFISMPGILAFCYYPGSYVFLFCSMLLLGLAGAAIETALYKLCGANFILGALLAQVIAYRYAHFGYAPRQSYLLAGTILGNVLILTLLNNAGKLIAAKGVAPVLVGQK